MDFITIIEKRISDSIAVKQALLSDKHMLEQIENCAKIIAGVFSSGGCVLFCGNGGSAADAQHLAAEFSGRFYTDRDPLNAEALHVNTSYLTAVANDYSYNEVYSRLIKAKAKKGDVLFAISTSGNSENIIKAIEQAKKTGMYVIGFTGESGGKMKSLCDALFNLKSSDTPRIQESHILIGHTICELVEKILFNKEK